MCIGTTKRLLLALVLLFIAVQGAQAQSLVSHTEGSNKTASTQSTIATSSTMNVASGNTLVACVRQGTNNTAPSSVGDGGSNAFTHITASDATFNSTNLLSLWVNQNSVANATATFTATWGTAQAFNSILVRQYSGVALSGAVDASGTGTAAGPVSSVTSSAFTTTQAAELIAVCATASGTTLTFSAGSIGGTTAANLLADGAGGAEMTGEEDLTVSSIQTAITAAMSNGTSVTGWEISVVTLKAPSSSAGGAGAGGSVGFGGAGGVGD
jgi:hypothetical protein